MKKIILSLMGVCLASGLMAQTIFVDTTAQNKNVVFEEYTGVNCGYCPLGHQNGNALATAHPGRVVLVNIHQGGYAQTTPNYIIENSAWVDAWANQTGLEGYPAGTVNRRVFSGSSTAITASDNASVTSAANTVLAESSFVNTAVQASVDASTRVMTVTVQTYYTGNAETSTNKLNVVLLQDSIIGSQHNYGNYNSSYITADGQYIHMHMLRQILTGEWGDTLAANAGDSVITAGTLITKTYIDTLPATIRIIPLELGSLRVAAYVAKNNQTIYTGNECTPSYINLPVLQAQIYAKSVTEVRACADSVTPSLQVRNTGSTTITSMEIGYYSDNNAQQTYTWSGSLPMFSNSANITLPNVLVNAGTQSVINYEIKSINGTAQTGLTSTMNVTKAAALAFNTTDRILLKLKTDKYGSETTWLFRDVASGDTIATGGPYADGSQHTIYDTFTVAASGCYVFEIFDAYGDGINAGQGTGYYYLYNADSTQSYKSNGKYGSGEYKAINVTTSSLQEVANAITSLSIYPNPAKDVANISVSLSQNTKAEVKVTDLMGRIVMNLGSKSLLRGENTISLNTSSLENGMYFISVNSNNGTMTQKITISK